MDLLEIFKDSEDVVDFPAKSVIAEVGTKGDQLYVVIEGEVTISINERVLATARAGEMVGEMALINSNIRSANLTAKTDCRLALIDQASFNLLLQHVPSFSLHVMKLLAERLRHAYEVIGQ